MLAVETVRGLLEIKPNPSEHKHIFMFLQENPQFFVGASLPAAQLMLRAADAILGCAVVSSDTGN